MASTVIMIATLGAIDMTGKIRMSSFALLNIAPHSAVGG